jgi:hypothetical protein
MRHENRTIQGRITYSSLVNNEFDTFFSWCYWQVPLRLHESFKYPIVAGWLEMRPREYSV